MTEDNMESQQNEFGNLVLPENGVTDLTDKLTEYMTEIELGGVPDILGPVSYTHLTLPTNREV